MLNNLRLLTLAVLFHATSSWAVPMDYTFDIIWSSGDLAGTSSPVFLTLDELTGSGSETFQPNSATPNRLNSFETTIDGILYQAEGDFDFPSFPLVALSDGTLERVDYLSTDLSKPAFFINFQFGLQLNEVQYSGVDDNNLSAGTVDAASFRPDDSGSVPAPATLALFGLGLVGLGISRRKRQTHA